MSGVQRVGSVRLARWTHLASGIHSAATQGECAGSNEEEQHSFLSAKWNGHCGTADGLGRTATDDDVIGIVGQNGRPISESTPPSPVS